MSEIMMMSTSTSIKLGRLQFMAEQRRNNIRTIRDYIDRNRATLTPERRAELERRSDDVTASLQELDDDCQALIDEVTTN